MNWLQPPRRHDVVTIPIVWIAVVASLLVHVAALWILLPRLPLLTTDAREPGRASSLAVQLAPRTTQVADAAAAAPPPPQPAKPAPPASPRPRQTPVRSRSVTPRVPPPPVIALDKVAPRALELPPASEPLRVPAPAAQPAPLPAEPAEDLAAYIEARRRARGETSTPSADGSAKSAEETDLERRNRIVTANLGLDRTPTFGHDPRNAGGLFQIRELHYDDAEFYFFGFDKDIHRNAKQLIDVRRGDNSDIRIAVVRKMIAIIRDSVAGDFQWVSQRLGREVTLSARPGDNAGLEEFIMRDVFPEGRVP